MRMAVAQHVDRDAGREIEIFLALLAIEIDPLAAHRPHRRTRINGHERRDGHGVRLLDCDLAVRSGPPARRPAPIASGPQKGKGAPDFSGAPSFSTSPISSGGAAVAAVPIVRLARHAALEVEDLVFERCALRRADARCATRGRSGAAGVLRLRCRGSAPRCATARGGHASRGCRLRMRCTRLCHRAGEVDAPEAVAVIVRIVLIDRRRPLRDIALKPARRPPAPKPRRRSGSETYAFSLSLLSNYVRTHATARV